MGTSSGRLATFKLLPEPSGGYKVKYAGSMMAEGNIVSLSPINVDTGEPAIATQEIVGSLRNGIRVNGVLLAVTGTGARIFKPPAAKGAHKSWDDCICHQAAVSRFEAHTFALVGLFGDGTTKAFSVPGLREIGSTDISQLLDMRRLSAAIVTPTGNIVGWTGPSELALLNVWGSGQDLWVMNPCRRTNVDIDMKPELAPLIGFSIQKCSSHLGPLYPTFNGFQELHM